MRFEIEKQLVNREKRILRSFPDEELIVKDLEELLSRPENLLGEGKTAEVRIMKGNPEYCLKIIDDQRLEDLYGPERPTYNDEEIEFSLLEQASKIQGDVIVPRPLLSWKISTEERRKIGIIVMERLRAVSLKQIHEGVRLPIGFDTPIFFQLLQEYLERLHEEKQVHHRDIAEGNILVEKETNRPCLIDFGDSVRVSSGERPYTIRDDFGRVIRSYPNDMRALAEVRRRLTFLPQLTEVNK